MDISPLKPNELTLATHMHQSLAATLPNPLSKKQLQDPKLWQFVTSKIVPGAEIRVTDKTCSMFARLFVIFSDQRNVRVEVLEYHTFESPKKPTEQKEEFEVKWRGTRFCIMQRGKSEPIKDNIPNKEVAERELAEYRAALAR